jgi:biopolymer transport protein ExbD
MALGKQADDEGTDGGLFSDINITPLTDIFLVLLIIFMVTSSIAVHESTRSGVKVNLPKGTNKEIDPGAKSLVISVLKTNELLAQGQKVAESDLKKLFDSAFAKDPTTTVIIEADEGVTHGKVVGVMEIAKQAGLSKLAIATKGGRGGGK